MGKQQQKNTIDNNYIFDDTGYDNLIIEYYTTTYDYDFEYVIKYEYEYEN